MVKNESRIIKRCLDSVKGLVDYWIITDTGSTDDTKKIIAETMSGVPGELIDLPWTGDSGKNRTEVLKLAKDKSDYSLFIDADEFLVFTNEFDKNKFKESLTADVYDFTYKHGDIVYVKNSLTRNELGWSYIGKLHEFASSRIPVSTRGLAVGVYQSTFSDGAESQNPRKYEKHAEALELAVEVETDAHMRTRYIFYLAQSYRDSDNHQKAYENYLKRAGLGGWNEEVFVSFLNAGKLAIRLGKEQGEIISLFSKAFCAAPWRSESVHAAAFYLRNRGEYGTGYLLAKAALDIPNPGTKSLFVNSSVYDYALLDEYAICAYYAQKYEECHSSCLSLLKSGKLPAQSVERVAKNMVLCEGKFSPSFSG